MDRLSSFERVVGNIPEEEKERILRNKGELFDDQVFEKLKNEERRKTLNETKIIHLANEVTNEIRKQYGLGKFELPPQNIHIIKEKSWPGKNAVAFYNSMLQGILIREQPSRIVFMKKVLHEMLHFKSYNALQATNSESPELKEYRVGLTVHTRDDKAIYFANLNEAVTEELTKRALLNLVDNGFCSDEMRETLEIKERYPYLKTAEGDPLFNDDTFQASTEAVNYHVTSSNVSTDAQKIATENFTYKQARKNLNILIAKLAERNPGEYGDKEEIFDEFARAMITGNILPVGRLIEKTFGRGTLRKIGELDQDIAAQTEFIKSL